MNVLTRLWGGYFKGFHTTKTSYFNTYPIGHVFDLNTAAVV